MTFEERSEGAQGVNQVHAHLKEGHSRKGNSQCKVSEPTSHVQETSKKPMWLQWNDDRKEEQEIQSELSTDFTGTCRQL